MSAASPLAPASPEHRSKSLQPASTGQAKTCVQPRAARRLRDRQPSYRLSWAAASPPLATDWQLGGSLPHRAETHACPTGPLMSGWPHPSHSAPGRPSPELPASTAEEQEEMRALRMACCRAGGSAAHAAVASAAGRRERERQQCSWQGSGWATRTQGHNGSVSILQPHQSRDTAHTEAGRGGRIEQRCRQWPPLASGVGQLQRCWWRTEARSGLSDPGGGW